MATVMATGTGMATVRRTDMGQWIRTAPASRSSQTSQTDKQIRHPPRMAAVAAVATVAAVLCVEVARLTIAARIAETNPPLAEQLAPDIPPVLVSKAMAEVGQAAAQAATPGRDTLNRLRRVAAAAPLQPEPLLVEAAMAEKAGHLSRAEGLLVQARRLEPRSVAARYLLADLWLREEKVTQGLGEMAVLARLLPGTTVQLVPALSQYAHSPGAPENLKAILKRNPSLKPPLLSALAADPDNADLVLSLAGNDVVAQQGEPRHWQRQLLDGYVQRGEFDRAYALWRKFAAMPAGSSPLLFNGDFTNSAAPPPFNWRLASTGAGVAEPENGRLRVIFYGRENATLASQMLLLPPGTYRFQAPVTGRPAEGALEWRITCLPGHQRPLHVALSGAKGAFSIPGSCPAQVLSLDGRVQDMPEESDITVGPVAVERING